jgi:hypothetical protein
MNTVRVVVVVVVVVPGHMGVERLGGHKEDTRRWEGGWVGVWGGGAEGRWTGKGYNQGGGGCTRAYGCEQVARTNGGHKKDTRTRVGKKEQSVSETSAPVQCCSWGHTRQHSTGADIQRHLVALQILPAAAPPPLRPLVIHNRGSWTPAPAHLHCSPGDTPAPPAPRQPQTCVAQATHATHTCPYPSVVSPHNVVLS